MKKGDRVKVYGRSFSDVQWNTEGTATLYRRDPEEDGHTVPFFQCSRSDEKLDGPLEYWIIRFDDEAEFRSRWVSEQHLIE